MNKRKQLLIQVFLATAITMLIVAATVSATTIGTNVSTGGTLTVTGATALNGGLTMDTNKFTIADTSGNTTIAGTLGVTGVTTQTGQLNFVNASSTGWLKVNTINTDLASTTFSKDIVFPNASSTGYLNVSSIRSQTGTTTFNNSEIYLNDGSSNSMFFTNSGDIIGLGVMGQGWRINDDSGNYVAGAGYGPSMSAGFLAVQAPSEGVATIAANDSNGNSLLQLLIMESFNVGTILLSNSATMSTQIQFEDSDADDQVYFWLDQTENRLEMYGTDGTETTQPGFLIGGRTQTSNYGLSSNDLLIANDIEV